MSAPSPGPWAIDKVGNTYVITSGRGKLTDIVGIANILPNDLANACLLAAGPRLLQAGEKALALIAQHHAVLPNDLSAEIILDLDSAICLAKRTSID